MWTRHGHQIVGTVALDPIIHDRPTVARCGGPAICKQCQMDVGQFQKEVKADEFGNIPLLDDTADNSRMLGRIRYALILTRPMSEVDLICERMARIISEHKVLTEQSG